MNQDKEKDQNQKPSIGRIEVVRGACITAAECLALAPDTFELDEEGLAIITDQKGSSDQAVWDSAIACPTNAIVLYDEKGNRIYPPKGEDPEIQPGRDKDGNKI